MAARLKANASMPDACSQIPSLVFRKRRSIQPYPVLSYTPGCLPYPTVSSPPYYRCSTLSKHCVRVNTTAIRTWRSESAFWTVPIPMMQYSDRVAWVVGGGRSGCGWCHGSDLNTWHSDLLPISVGHYFHRIQFHPNQILHSTLLTYVLTLGSDYRVPITYLPLFSNMHMCVFDIWIYKKTELKWLWHSCISECINVLF